MIKSDCHMHTCFSADSEATVTSMLDAAVEKGLEGVCITDHMSGLSGDPGFSGKCISI